jgi:K+-sensing histidine kinase KdpD
LSGKQRLFGVRFLLVTLPCAGMALVLSMVCRDHALKAAVPVVFLLTLVPATQICGRVASLVVAIVAAFIFAAYLFEPYGSLTIHRVVDQIELLCFGIAAIGVVRFSPSAEALLKTAPQPSDGNSPLSSSSGARANLLESWIALMGYAIVLMAIVTLLLYMWN